MPNRFSMHRVFLDCRFPSLRLGFFNERIIPLKNKNFYRPEDAIFQGKRISRPWESRLLSKPL
jgi:hypothetical protein